MKTKLLLSLKLSRKIVFFLFTLFTANTFAQITGTHSIGAGQEYLTIQEAVDSLVSQGVSGHVIFNLVDGNYNEQISIDEIPGVDADSTITFQSSTLDPNDVTIYFSALGSGDNYVILINGADYITFQYLKIWASSTGSYARAIRLVGTATNLSFLNNKIIGQNIYSYSANYALISSYQDILSNLRIENNEFYDGSYPIYIYAHSSAAISDSIVIKDNIFNSFCELHFDFANNIEISGNEINSDYYNGIYLYACNNAITIKNNIINSYCSEYHSGIYLHTCVGSMVFKGLLANNFVVVDGDDNDDNHGINLYGCQHQNIYNNSVHVTGSNSDNGVLYAYGGNDIEIINNIFAHSSHGYAIEVSGTGNVTACDYNNYYTAGNYLASWNGAILDNLQELQTANSMDNNSLSIYPNFVLSTNTDLHVQTHWLSGVGTNTTQGEVPTDIDGEIRDGSTPDIGADEFTPTNTAKYSGGLTIKPGGGGTFFTFTEAIDSLTKLGVSAAVNILVDDETYTEQIEINEIPGANATNTITFTSASNDSTKVILEHESLSSTDNYVVNLNAADYITFKKMTIRNTGSTYARVFNLQGNAHNNSIENNILTGSGSSGSTNHRTIIYSDQDIIDTLTIANNIFTAGSRGIYLYSYVNEQTSCVNINNNTFENHYSSIYLSRHNNFNVSNNIIQDFTCRGNIFEYCTSPYSIYNNKISSTTTTVNYNAGLYFYDCNGSGNGGLVYNNFIHNENSIQVSGIVVYNSSYLSFYHNSINIISSSEDSKAFYYYSSGSNIYLKNNILSVEGQGYPLYITNGTAITESDYNNLYTTGSHIGYWIDQIYESLEAFQTASGKEEHSINVAPGYFSDSDLHTNSPWLDNSGISIAEVTEDIDGDARAGTPDIGADEYTSTISPLSGTYTIGSGEYFETFNDAIDSLILGGIADTVFFNVVSGTYTENMLIPQISGTNDNAAIIFQPHPDNVDDVIISYQASSANDNYLVYLDGADYITFKGIIFQTSNSLYASAFVLSGACNKINILNNILEGRPSTTSDYHDALIITKNQPLINDILIEGNTFNNGSYGICLTGVVSYYSENPKIKNNIINTFYYGIYIAYCKAPVIESNEITYTNPDYYGKGIYLESCINSLTEGPKIINNIIYSDSRSYSGGIYLYHSDAVNSHRGLIANNVIRLSSNAKDYSIGIRLQYSDCYDVYYNSVNITCNHSSDRALEISSCNYIDIKNNNFAIRGDLETSYSGHGYAIYIYASNNITSDYNNLYSPGKYLAHNDGNYTNLSTYQNGSGMDASSVFYFPAFPALNDLSLTTPWLDGVGTPLSITEDIDGNPRDGTNPDIGAYEYTSTLTPMNGTYTFGSAGDIPSFDSLKNALLTLGISGPVTIDILSGLYFDAHIKLRDIPGTSSSDTVLIQSQSGNPEDFELGYTQSSTDNYMISLNGTDYITFRNLQFTSGGSTYGRIFYISGNSNNINIENNIFNGVPSTYDNASLDIIATASGNYSIIDSLLIKNNTFNNGSYGLRYIGCGDYDSKGLEILNNSFNDQYTQIYMDYSDAPVISNNEFNEVQRYSINLYQCDEDLQILNNKISSSIVGAMGIYISHCVGTIAKKGLIANNFVYINCSGLSGYASAIELYISNYQRVYHNSAHITGTNGGIWYYANTFVSTNGGSNFVYNNIFANTGDGRAYNTNNTTGIPYSDNNNIYSAGSNPIHYNGSNYTTLASYQTASGKDGNSLDIEPVFMSNSDLHLLTDDLEEQGVYFAEVSTDIDGDPRDISTPDIGADELHCVSPTLKISDLFICLYDTVAVVDSSTGITSGSAYYWDFNGDDVTDDTTYTYDTEISYVYDVAGNYTAKLTVVQLGGCTDDTTFSVTVYEFPDIPVAPDVIGCYGQNIPNLEATGTEIEWYNDAELTSPAHSGNSFATSQTELGVYSYFVTQTVNGCVSLADSVSLTINETPVAPVSHDTISCSGVAAYLEATGENILWYDNSDLMVSIGSGSPWESGETNVGIYSYYVTQTVNGCESTEYDSISLTIGLTPDPPVTADVNGCNGTVAEDLTTVGDNVIWYNDGELTDTVFEGNTFSTGISTTGEYIYYVTQTVNNCQSLSDTVVLTIYDIPDAPVSHDTISCDGIAVDIEAIGENILWYDNSDLMSSIGSGSPWASGETNVGLYSYYVTQTVNGCESTEYDSISLTIFAIPDSPVTADVNGCNGTMAEDLTAAGDNIMWYSDITLTNLLFTGNPFSTGISTTGEYIYYVTQTVNNCQSLPDSVILTIYDIPEQPVAEDVTVCENVSIPNLIASGENISWYSDVDLTILVHSDNIYEHGIVTVGIYNFYVTQTVNACTSLPNTVTLTINEIPDAPVSHDTISCTGVVPDLEVTGENILWYDNSNLAVSIGSGSPWASGETDIGLYTFYVTQTVNGCESTEYDSITLTIGATPEPPVAEDVNGCNGTEAEDLTAVGDDIMWYSDITLTNLLFAGNTFSTGISITGEYIYYVTQNVDYCESLPDTVTLTIYDIPDQPVVENVTVCENESIPNLIALGENISWYSDVNLTNLVHSDSIYEHGIVTAGTYNFYVTQTVNGCESNYIANTLSILNSPEQPVAQSVSICEGDTVPNLSAEGVNIIWYNDEELTDTVFEGNNFATGITEAGEYTYYVTQNIGQCSSFPTVVILVIKPLPVINSVVTNIDCQGNDLGSINLTISGGSSPFYFVWSTGETTEDIKDLLAGEYFVTVTDAGFCQSTDSFTITQPDSIILVITTTESNCGSSNGTASVEASGGNPPYKYQWTNGSTEAAIEGLASGIYIVTVTDNIGCSEFGIATINDEEGPMISIVAVQDVSCNGGSNGAINVSVSQGSPPYTFAWSNGAITEDITNLTAGPYELIVIDSDSCMAVKSIVVNEPDALNLILSVFKTSCGGADGSATAIVTGGTPNYTYNWSNGSTGTSIYSLALGVYSITVTDNNSCEISGNFAVSEEGAPYIAIDSVVEGTCGNTDGAIYISVYGGTGEYSYLWSNGSTNKDLIGVNPGTYNVTVSDGSSCDAIEVATIESDRPPVNPICLVTVDSLTNHNLIVWEKLQTTGVSAYNVYKESTQSGRYFLIATYPFDSLSIFEDILSNSLQRSWRYKLSVVDSCGAESELSAHHKTMHLTINLGINNTVNLIWDHYEGFDFETYYIHRYSEDEWELIDSIPNNLTSYTDFSPPESDVFYQIEIKHPTGCDATKATNKNSSRSNVSNTVSPGTFIKNISDNIKQLSIYPNPNNGLFNLSLELNNSQNVLINIYDVQGKLIITEKLGKIKGIVNKEININNSQKGLFYLQIITDKTTMIKKVIIY